MRRFSSLVVVLAVAALAACGVTDTGEFREIPANEFPGGLRVTIPPTTTTTTTTTAPPGPTTTEPTVTLPPAPTEIIQIFYVQGIRVRAVSIEERSPVLVQRKLFELTERRGMMSSELRLATVLPAGAILNGDIKRGVTSVELGSTLDSVLPEDLPLFFAQIVLTVLPPSRQGQVVFTLDGQPYPPVKADQTVLEAGAPVVWEDYEELIFGEPQPPVSTTTLFGPP